MASNMIFLIFLFTNSAVSKDKRKGWIRNWIHNLYWIWIRIKRIKSKILQLKDVRIFKQIPVTILEINVYQYVNHVYK